MLHIVLIEDETYYINHHDFLIFNLINTYICDNQNRHENNPQKSLK